MKFYEEEWQRLRERTGLQTYPMTFALADPSDRDSYTIRSTEEGGCITGSNERSLLQGVYRFLYNYGVRYPAPGRRYEYFPERYDPQRLVQTETVRPPYDHRGVCIEGADSFENVVDMIDWLPKIGMNTFFLQFREPDTFLRRWYAHTGNPLLAEEPFDAPELSRQIDREIAKRGLLHHRVGHGWTGAVLQTGAQGWDAENSEATPEQAAMCAEIDGKRSFFGGVPLNTNLCMSDPRVRQRFIEEVVTYAKAHPEVSHLHVWLADDCNNHCECAACRQMTPTDHYVRILNGIDAALTEEGLPTRIVFLIYLELLWPPASERLENPDRFTLMFAPISRRFESGYAQVQAAEQIPPFVLNHIQLPTSVEENLAFLREWQKVFSGDSFDYDYHLGRAHYGDPGYMQIARRIGEDVRALKSLGLNGMIACQELRAGFPHWLPDYVMGMTLTDPALDYDRLAEDYCLHAYGPYASTVRKYLEALSALSSPDWFNGKGPRVREDLVPRYVKALETVRQFRPQVETMSDEHPVTARFLAILRYHADYAESYLSACIAKLQGEEVDAAAFKQLIRSRETVFQECLDVYRIQEVMHNYTKIG